MFGNTEFRVLAYMVDHPWWHYPLDLVKAGVISRWSMVTIPVRLEMRGFVERREVPSKVGGPPRTQFRTRVVRPPDLDESETV